MQEIIKSEFPLAVLMLGLQREPDLQGPGRVVIRCQVQVDGENITAFSCDGKDLGMPLSFQDARQYLYTDPPMALPSGPLAEARAALADVRRTRRPLWIQMDYGSSILPMAPWERLFAPVVDGPVLRMPYYTTRPEASPDALDVALVASSPDEERRFAVEDMLRQHVTEILQAASVETKIHIFADAGTWDRLTLTTPLPADPRIVLYPSHDAPRHRPSGDAPADTVDAWFPWIESALEGQSIDVLHFIAHGYVGSNQGMLVLAEAPEDPPGRADADVIGARAIHALGQRLGAWCTMLTAPPTNYSVLGQRLLADAIARQRPGPVGLYEARSTNPDGNLAQTYRFLCGFSTTPAVGNDQMIYVHPARTAAAAEKWSPSAEAIANSWTTLGADYTAAGGKAAEMLRTGRGAPLWLASYQRGLERLGSELNAPTQQVPPQPLSGPAPGTDEALRFLASAARSYLDNPGGEVK